MSYEDMERMFGYGQPSARLWSVGLEEHCDEKKLSKRIALRKDAGEYICLYDFHINLLNSVPTKVSVWDITHEIYKQVYGQPTKYGGINPEESDILFTEILPLPRKGHDSWPQIYNDWWPGGLNQYIKAALPKMSKRLLERVRTHRPQIVLLHGKTQHKKWIYKNLSKPKSWRIVPLGNGRNETAQILKWEGTLWVLSNNFVNNQNVRWPPELIDNLVCAIRDAMTGLDVLNNGKQ